MRSQTAGSSAGWNCHRLFGFSLVVNLVTFFATYCFLSPPKTREQEELEELLLLEQQGNEQRRLEVLQEEQRQLQTKKKNKQALLDELVRCTHIACTWGE